MAEFASRTSSIEEELLQIYNKALDKYSNSFPSQQAYLFLRRMSMDCAAPMNLKQQPFLRMLADTCKDLHLNELEIAMFAILIETVLWKHYQSSSAEELLFAGYSAKFYMNENMEMFTNHLLRKDPDFLTRYQDWLAQNQNLIRVTPKKLNKKYKYLSQPPSMEDILIDYNYYVDEILVHAPASTLEREAKPDNSQLKVEEKEEDPPLPEMMKLDSVIGIWKNEPITDITPRLIRGPSVFDQGPDVYQLEPLPK